MKNVVLNRAALPKPEPEASGPWRAVHRLLASLTARVNDLSAGGLNVRVGPMHPIDKSELAENLYCREITMGGVTFTALTRD